MAFMDFLFGSPGRTEQLSTITPQQSAFMQQLMGGLQGQQSGVPGMNYLQSLFSQDPSAFSEFEAPMMRQFNEQIVPGIAERFSGQGSGMRGSSALNQTLGQAGQRLSESLASQRANLRSGAMNQLQNMMNLGMNPQFENLMFQPQQGMMQGLAGGVGQGLGAMGGMGAMSYAMPWMQRLFSQGQ